MNTNIGENIRDLRIASKITQKDLAKYLNLTVASISAYENGIRMPSYDILIKIASIFRVSTDNLLGFNNSYVIDISGLNAEQRNIIFEIIELYRLKNMKNNSIIVDKNVVDMVEIFKDKCLIDAEKASLKCEGGKETVK